jgi:GWxTD domain-containing protein
MMRATGALVAAASAACAPTYQRITARELPLAFDLSTVCAAPETYGTEDLRHLRLVLDEPRIAAYPSLSPEERREMLRLRWAELDPTPTTDRNERKETHYRRLAYALAEFARKGDPGWDKRGELLLRFGPPQEREIIPAVIEVGEIIPPRERWTYAYPEMAFEVADLLLQDDFQDSFRWMKSGRVDMAHGGGPIDRAPGVAPEIAAPTVGAEAAQFRAEKLYGNGVRAVGEGGIGQAYLHDFGAGKLDYLLDVLHFASPDSLRSTLEVNLLFDSADLRFEERTAELDVELVAKTQGYEEVARASHRMRETQRSEGGLVLDKLSLDLPPGSYRLALQARDVRSGRVGIYTTETQLKAFTRDRLDLSDVQVASSVKGGRVGHRFCKGSILVVPNPGSIFRRGRDAGLYFEIYGLALGEDGVARFTVRIAVTGRKPPGRRPERPSVAISHDDTARRRDVSKHFSFDTGGLPAGIHDVEVTVTDHVGGRSVTRTTPFSVVVPP